MAEVTVGSTLDATIAAKKINSTVDVGKILVAVAQDPRVAALRSTAATTAAGGVATALGVIIGLLVPNHSAEIATGAGLLAIPLNYLFQWLRNRKKNAETPGAQTGPTVSPNAAVAARKEI